MASVVTLYRSAIGKKAVMALSGIVLAGFVLGHMLGNLKLYLGAEELNHYAEGLRSLGAPLLPRSGALWIARGALLAAVAVHLVAALQVTLASRAARPIRYGERRTIEADYAARTMRWGGVIVLLFVLYHLAHFTFGAAWAHPDFRPGDVYHNVVAGFRIWWVSGFYIVAQIALGLHVSHGLWSLFQSLGSDRGSARPWRRRFARAFAAAVTLGNVSFPVAVLTGLVR